MNKKILWLDNDVSYVEPYVEELELEGYATIVVKSVAEAEELIKNNQFALLILDVMIPTTSEEEKQYPSEMTDFGHKVGLHFYRRMKRFLDAANTRVVVMTIRIDKDISDEFIQAGLPRDCLFTKISVMKTPEFLGKVKGLIER